MFEDISPLMEAILAIDGVAVAQIYMYKFYVRKSPIYSWAEVDPKIMELLRGIPLACGEDEGDNFSVSVEEVIHETRFADEYKQPEPPAVEPGPSGNDSLITGA